MCLQRSRWKSFTPLAHAPSVSGFPTSPTSSMMESKPTFSCSVRTSARTLASKTALTSSSLFRACQPPTGVQSFSASSLGPPTFRMSAKHWKSLRFPELKEFAIFKTNCQLTKWLLCRRLHNAFTISLSSNLPVCSRMCRSRRFWIRLDLTTR